MSTAKAANGSGSVTFDKASGSFVARVTGPDGRRIKRRAATEREAWLALDRMLSSAGQAVPDPTRVTVRGVLHTYRDEVLPAKDRSHRWREVQRWAIAIIDERIGSRQLTKLSVGGVDKLLEQLAREGYSRESLVKIRSVLGQVLDWAVRRDLVHRNVARLAELPAGAARTPEQRALTVVEAQRLLDAAADDRLEVLWVLMLSTGLRPGEALGLSWADVDLNKGVVHVRRSLKLGPDGPEITEALKTRRSRRSVGLSARATAALTRWRALQEAERLTVGPGWGEGWSGVLFTTHLGTPLRPENARRSFRTLCERAELGRWKLNELRHSCASLLSEAGVPVERIADVLGHDGIRMTQLVYRHQLAPSVPHAAGPMDEMFGK